MQNVLFTWTTENGKEIVRLNNGTVREFKTKSALRKWWRGFDDAFNLSKGHDTQKSLCKAEGQS